MIWDTHSQIINNLHAPLTKKNVNLCEEEKWFPANKIFPLTFQKIRIRYSFFPDFPDALNPVICDFKCEMLN